MCYSGPRRQPSFKENFLSLNNHPIKGFGIETLLGVSSTVCDEASHPPNVFEQNGGFTTLNGYIEVAVSGNGMIAVVTDGTFGTYPLI
jgi:hypothetical protein